MRRGTQKMMIAKKKIRHRRKAERQKLAEKQGQLLRKIPLSPDPQFESRDGT